MTSTADFSKMPAVLAKMRKAIDVGVGRAAGVMVLEAKKLVSGGPRHTHAGVGQPPKKQTGQLGRGIGQTAVVGGRCRVVAKARHSHTQEFGRKIYAVRGKALPSPLNPKAERMLERLGARGSLRSYGTLFVVKPGNGKPSYLAMKEGKRGKIVPMFALRRAVRIRPHPFMRPALEKSRPKIVEHIRASVRTIMGGV